MVSNRDLPEDKFFAEKYSKNPFPLWLWLFVVIAVSSVTWGSYSWWDNQRNIEISGKPFLQVTNRNFSLFLWQFPQYMRANYPAKTGYLPAFQEAGGVGLVPAEAGDYVQVREDILFLYHTWNRLLKEEYFSRPIPREEFLVFLDQTQIWLPANWTRAPDAYKKFVGALPTSGDESLENAARPQLPLDVRIAFQGWRNYYKEGKAIDAVAPTYAELAAFLNVAPHYARNYWRNIVLELRPNYLLTLASGQYDASAQVPDEELDGFLKVAFYNYSMARKGS